MHMWFDAPLDQKILDGIYWGWAELKKLASKKKLQNLI